jgi:hypothetical protein
MMTEENSKPAGSETRPARKLSPAAQRALAEAEARRKSAGARPTPPKEIGGPKGPDPVRYGDWEIKGRVSDF